MSKIKPVDYTRRSLRGDVTACGFDSRRLHFFYNFVGMFAGDFWGKWEEEKDREAPSVFRSNEPPGV